jgi:hypothetical protein
VDLNTDVDQSKVFLDPLLGGLFEERKCSHIIFWATPKEVFNYELFGELLRRHGGTIICAFRPLLLTMLPSFA